jgi:hypothetical protein
MRPQPRVRNKIKHTSVVTTVTPEIARHSPRNGFTVSFVLSSATNSSCHRHPRIKVLSARSGRRASANLTPATGARTTRLRRTQHLISAKGFDGPSAVRLRAIRQLTSRVDPPCHPLTSPDAAASTASRPTSVTIASRPSCRNRTAQLSELIWVRSEGRYFCKRGWTGFC